MVFTGPCGTVFDIPGNLTPSPCLLPLLFVFSLSFPPLVLIMFFTPSLNFPLSLFFSLSLPSPSSLLSLTNPFSAGISIVFYQIYVSSCLFL